MPRRMTPLVTGEYYHVFNRGVERRKIFLDRRELRRAILTLRYYQFQSPLLRLSRFMTLPNGKRDATLNNLKSKSDLLVEFVAFCLMPNHFHFLLRQEIDGGISRFMSNFQNSFTRYFNTKNGRDGHLLRGQFKAVRIETDNQLLHLSRYIHLNPLTSAVVKDIKDLLAYPWSSLPEYVSETGENICSRKLVLSFFGSPKEYRKFVCDRTDYQRKLKGIQELLED